MPTAYPISAVVLAAGSSTRMGTDNKLLLPWGDRRIIEVVVDTLAATRLIEIILVIGHEDEKVTVATAKYPVRIVKNQNFSEGMSSSIREGIQMVNSEACGYLIVLGDMPEISADTVDALCSQFCTIGNSGIVLPTKAGRRGHPVLFGKEYRHELMTLSGDLGARRIVSSHPGCTVEVPVNSDGIFVDVDTPSAYRAHNHE